MVTISDVARFQQLPMKNAPNVGMTFYENVRGDSINE